MKKIVVIIAVTEKRIGLKNKKPEIKIANPTTKLLIINELKQKVKIDIINIIVIKIKKKICLHNASKFNTEISAKFLYMVILLFFKSIILIVNKKEGGRSRRKIENCVV
jgi:hypothetical protein